MAFEALPNEEASRAFTDKDRNGRTLEQERVGPLGMIGSGPKTIQRVYSGRWVGSRDCHWCRASLGTTAELGLEW